MAMSVEEVADESSAVPLCVLVFYSTVAVAKKGEEPKMREKNRDEGVAEVGSENGSSPSSIQAAHLSSSLSLLTVHFYATSLKKKKNMRPIRMKQQRNVYSPSLSRRYEKAEGAEAEQRVCRVTVLYSFLRCPLRCHRWVLMFSSVVMQVCSTSKKKKRRSQRTKGRRIAAVKGEKQQRDLHPVLLRRLCADTAPPTHTPTHTIYISKRNKKRGSRTCRQDDKGHAASSSCSLVWPHHGHGTPRDEVPFPLADKGYCKQENSHLDTCVVLHLPPGAEVQLTA
jgi:hypothetical protein